MDSSAALPSFSTKEPVKVYDTDDDTEHARSSSLDLAAVQQSSIGITLFKLFNDGSMDEEDDTDEDSDDDEKEEDEEEEEGGSPDATSAALAKQISKASITDKSDTSDETPKISVTTTSDSEGSNMSRLAQSIHSMVTSSSRATRRGSKSGAASIKSLKKDDECKKRAALIAETLRTLGVQDNDVLVAGKCNTANQSSLKSA